MNNEFEWKVNGRTIRFPTIDGLTQLQQEALVGEVEQRMRRVMDRTNMVDTSKQAIVAAYELAAELLIVRQSSEDNTGAMARSMDKMISRLEAALPRK